MKLVLAFLGGWFRQHDYSPSFREVADGVYMAHTTVYGVIARLVRRGYVTLPTNEDGRAIIRSMYLTLEGRHWCACQRLSAPVDEVLHSETSRRFA